MRRKPTLPFLVGWIGLGAGHVGALSMVSRWGHAATYIPSPPSLLIAGGRTARSPTDSGYTSSPNTADAFLLPLNTSFATDSASWQALTTSDAPAQSWYSLSPLTSSGDSWTLLAFGGDKTDSPTPTGNDSACLAELNVGNGSLAWTPQAAGWADEPMRRIYHSVATGAPDYKVYITGGLKDDGSNQVFTDTYAFDPATPDFVMLSPLPQGIFHHSSVLLPNGTLLVVGGAYHSSVNDNPAVVPLASLLSLDTTLSTATWSTITLGGSASPAGRRGATATLTSDNAQLILYGGTDAALTTAFSEIWILDLQTLEWTQSSPGGQGAGARFDHSAVVVAGDQILIFGGYRGSEPADADTWVFDAKANQWTGSYSAGTAASEAFNPVPSQVTKPSATPSSSTSTLEPVMSVSNGQTIILTPSAGPEPSSVPGTLHGASVLDASEKVAIGVSALAIAGLLLSVLILCIRRRRRKQANARAVAWKGHHERRAARGLGATSGLSYDAGIEKGTAGLLDPGGQGGSGSAGSEKPLPLLGLGIAAANSAVESLSRAFRSRRIPSSDPYAQLADMDSDRPAPPALVRRISSSRPSKYKLFGPRTPPASSRSGTVHRHTPVQKAMLIKSEPSIHSTTGRLDMFKDEDTRRFSVCREETEEADGQVQKDGGWHSARSLVGTQISGDTSDEDEDEDEQLAVEGLPGRRLMSGGPVPTPTAQGLYSDPFTDTAPYPRRSRTAAALAAPLIRTQGYNDVSLPRSEGSLGSTILSDPGQEGAAILHASRSSLASPKDATAQLRRNDSLDSASSPVTQLSEQLDSAFSPFQIQTEWEPVRRSQSFLKRMTGGGIVGLFGAGDRSSVGHGSNSRLDIRDPSPAPALWDLTEESPLQDYEQGASYKENAHNQGFRGPSYNSLQSARSLRDVTVAMREPTGSSFVSEAATTSDGLTDADFGAADMRQTQRFETAATAGADPPPRHDSRLSRASPPYAPIAEADVSLMTPSRRPFGSSNTSRASRSTMPPPTDPPTPSSFLSARRPVRDIVASINKRASNAPLLAPHTPADSVFSPVSKYSSAPPTPKAGLPGSGAGAGSQAGSPTPTRNGARRNTLYEAVKREKLLVANPDRGAM